MTQSILPSSPPDGTSQGDLSLSPAMAGGGGSNALYLWVLMGLPGKGVERTSGLGHHPYTTLLQCPLPPQLFLCCLLNLQESGLLCEVRPGLGRRRGRY